MGACCEARQPGAVRRAGGLRFLDVEPFFLVVPPEETLFRVGGLGVPLDRVVAGPIAIIAAISTDTYERKIRVYQKHANPGQYPQFLFPGRSDARLKIGIEGLSRVYMWCIVRGGRDSDCGRPRLYPAGPSNMPDCLRETTLCAHGYRIASG